MAYDPESLSGFLDFATGKDRRVKPLTEGEMIEYLNNLPKAVVPQKSFFGYSLPYGFGTEATPVPHNPPYLNTNYWALFPQDQSVSPLLQEKIDQNLSDYLPMLKEFFKVKNNDPKAVVPILQDMAEHLTPWGKERSIRNLGYAMYGPSSQPSPYTPHTFPRVGGGIGSFASKEAPAATREQLLRRYLEKGMNEGKYGAVQKNFPERFYKNPGGRPFSLLEFPEEVRESLKKADKTPKSLPIKLESLGPFNPIQDVELYSKATAPEARDFVLSQNATHPEMLYKQLLGEGTPMSSRQREGLDEAEHYNHAKNIWNSQALQRLIDKHYLTPPSTFEPKLKPGLGET